MTTQGSEKYNENNHPFHGYAGGNHFALAHNGVLYNDKILRKKMKLPATKIETDSYIAVQLLEHFKTLSVENVARMAELVSGSFSFTMTDNNDTLWIVKGDSPLAMIHFPRLKLYVYASTKQILFSAISHTDLVEDISSGDFEMLSFRGGDIVQIDKHGTVIINRFEYDEYSSWGYNWRNYTNESNDTKSYTNWYTDEIWLEDLKSVARGMGFDDEDIEQLYNDGYTLDEIEDFIYSFYPTR